MNGRGGGSGSGGSGGASSGAWSEGEGSSAGASLQGDDDHTQAVLDLLSATRTPQVCTLLIHSPKLTNYKQKHYTIIIFGWTKKAKVPSFNSLLSAQTKYSYFFLTICIAVDETY